MNFYTSREMITAKIQALRMGLYFSPLLQMNKLLRKNMENLEKRLKFRNYIPLSNKIHLKRDNAPFSMLLY